MEIKDENLKPEEQIPVGVEKIFEKRRMERINKSFGSARSKLMHGGILLAVFTLLVLYFCLPVSKISTVNIQGNYYLSDSYIRGVADTKPGNVFYLTIPYVVSWRLEKDPLIEKADVSWSDEQTIVINVTEKKIAGYRYTEEASLLLTDNTTAELKSEYLDIIARVPLITGFESEEQTRMLMRAMNEVDPKMIEDMSEIKQYDLGYDSQAVCILMRSGGYFFSDFKGVKLINSYYSIYANLKNKNQCIYAESIGSGEDEALDTAYAKACPWDETTAEIEYWKDEDGNYITNSFGDQVAKHYYTIGEDKQQALDGSGNPIPIPLNREGMEVVDENFEEHYNAGYYNTGKLVLPEEISEESGEEEDENT